MWKCFTDCFTVLQYKIHPDHFYSFNKLVCYSTLLVIKYFLLYPYQWLINIHKVTVPVKLTVRGYRIMNHMCFIQYINGISENIFIQCCLYIWSICVIMKHCVLSQIREHHRSSQTQDMEENDPFPFTSWDTCYFGSLYNIDLFLFSHTK